MEGNDIVNILEDICCLHKKVKDKKTKSVNGFLSIQ